MMLSVNDQTFSKAVLESPYPVLVNFWAPWCGLCLLIQPTLLKFESEWHGNFKLVSVNADENFRLANTYRLRNLPTLILFDRGLPVQRLEGFTTREDLQRTLNSIMLDRLLQNPRTKPTCFSRGM